MVFLIIFTIGVFNGFNSFCCPSPTGACCLPNKTCTIITQNQCLSNNGIYNGNGVDCSNTSCGLCVNCNIPTACCAGNAGCQISTPV